LFAEVFQKPMTEQLWRWKYRNGTEPGFGVWRGDKLVAHYGGVGCDIVLDGKPARAIQSVDVMVATNARQGGRRQSPFFLSTSMFLERCIGYSQPHLLGYGFPSDRHLQLAQHLGLYAKVGGMSELTVPAATPALSDKLLVHCETLSQDNFAAHREAINALWQRMQASMPTAILVRKQSDWLQHRYLEHPEESYRLMLWRQRVTGRAIALVVIKKEPSRYLVMDVLAAAKDVPCALRLLGSKHEGESGLPMVYWLSSAWVARLQLAALPVKSLPISTPANIWTEGPKPATLQDRWYLTAGDTDFL
jgi:Acetyltransferase (GNAT) domain